MTKIVNTTVIFFLQLIVILTIVSDQAHAEIISLQGPTITKYDVITPYVLVDDTSLATACKINTGNEILIASNEDDYLREYDSDDQPLGQWVVSPYPDFNVNEGTHEIHCYQKNLNTQEKTIGDTINVTVDLTVPNKPMITGPTLTRDNTPTFIITKEEDQGFTYCKLNDGVYYLVPSDNSYLDNPLSYLPSNDNGGNLQDGQYILNCWQEDEAENQGNSENFIFTIDTITPSIINISIITGQVNGNPSLSFVKNPIFSLSNIDDDNNTIHCSIDNIDTVITSDTEVTTQSTSDLNDGNHTITCTQEDPAGNISTRNFIFTIDTIIPDAPIINGTGETTSNLPNFTISNVSDRVYCKVGNNNEDEVLGPTYSYSPGYLAIGTHVISCRNIRNNSLSSLVASKQINIVREEVIIPPVDPPPASKLSCSAKHSSLKLLTAKKIAGVKISCNQKVVMTFGGKITIKLRKKVKKLSSKKTLTLKLVPDNTKTNINYQLENLSVGLSSSDKKKIKLIKKNIKGKAVINLKWTAINSKNESVTETKKKSFNLK